MGIRTRNMAALTTKNLVQICRIQSQVVPALGAAAVSKRNASSNLAAFKRGRGGRSSFNGKVVTVFGASGFLGRYVVNKLGKTGSQIIIPYRSDPYFVKDLKLAGDLGQVLFLPFHLQDEESLAKAMKYSNVVINLIGRDWETRNFSFNDVHVEGARTIARVARESGVERLIHFSALNSSPNPKAIYVKGGSGFLKSKYEGELAVREEFPDATIMRPSDVFGEEDRFIRYYANKWRRQAFMVPLWELGTETVKQPVHCSDVAQGVLNAVANPDTAGQTYDCVGPKQYLLSELVDYFYRCMRFATPVPTYRFFMNPLFKAKVMWFEKAMPTNPILGMDKLDREHLSDIVTYRNPTLADLGVNRLTSIEERANYELKPFRSRAYVEESVGQIPDPEPPVSVKRNTAMF